MSARATPFHARTASSNIFNKWALRSDFTLAQDFGDPFQEALAARIRVVASDMSWRWRVLFQGGRAGDFLAQLMTRDVRMLEPGQSLKALWLNDSGAVRGAGVVARFASDKFLLIASAADASWIANAAAAFGIAIRDVTEDEGGLALIGPYARSTLEAAGLAADIAPLGFRKLFWRGLDVTLSRWGEQNGFEIWCRADDCLIVWDRIMRAGAPCSIQPAGLEAADILDIEAGIPRPFRDYVPAEDGFADAPTPGSFGLTSLIDSDHEIFNGRSAWLAREKSETKTLVGIEIESDTLAPFAVLTHKDWSVGRTLTSVYSPVLRRAIALAQIDRALSPTGTMLNLTLPASLNRPVVLSASARVCELPFLSPPDQIAP